jgi:hypothetical protein
MIQQQVERAQVDALARSGWERWLIRGACRRVPNLAFWAELSFGLVFSVIFLAKGVQLSSDYLLTYGFVTMPAACFMVYFYRCWGILLLHPERTSAERGRFADFLWRTRAHGRAPLPSRLLMAVGLLIGIIPFIAPLAISLQAWGALLVVFWFGGACLSMRRAYLALLERRD